MPMHWDFWSSSFEVNLKPLLDFESWFELLCVVTRDSTPHMHVPTILFVIGMYLEFSSPLL